MRKVRRGTRGPLEVVTSRGMGVGLILPLTLPLTGGVMCLSRPNWGVLGDKTGIPRGFHVPTLDDRHGTRTLELSRESMPGASDGGQVGLVSQTLIKYRIIRQ